MLACRETGGSASMPQPPTAEPNWIGPPIFAGTWTELAGEDALTVADRIGAGLRPTLPGECVNDYRIQRIRARRVACYPRLLLVESQARLGDDARIGLANHLFVPGEVWTLGGSSAPFHDANERGWLDLSSDAAVADYARLFCNLVRGDDGRFQLLESITDVAWLAGGTIDDAVHAAVAIGMRIDRDAAGARIEAPVFYGDTLFVAKFRLEANGMIEMTDDEPIAAGLPIARETWDRQFRLPPRGVVA